MIKAIFADFYGTIVYEDGEIVSSISRRICETGNAENASQVDSYWWNCFRTSFENSYGDTFKTQRELELQSIQDTIQHFSSTEDAAKLGNEMFEYWTKSPIFPEAKQFFQECPVPIYIVSNIDRQDILDAIAFHDLKPQAVFLPARMQSHISHGKNCSNMLWIKPV